MFRTWLFVPIACLLAAPAYAAGVDITADTITRDPYGAIVAEGDVVIKRQDETLKADQVTYDATNRRVTADGHVVIESKQGTIRAESASMHTVDKTGELHNAEATLKSGEILKAKSLVRRSESVMSAEEITFTSCPPEAQTWALKASSAVLDQEEGELTAKNTRLEIGGIPLFYTPYWSQVLKRKSGLLMPSVATGKVRGTEVSIPLYLAPADNWDVTLTPHLMTARGVMGEAELRFASQTGHTLLYAEGISDRQTNSQRSRLKADIEEKLPYDIFFSAQADHLSDQLYLADFGTDNSTTSTRYLQSAASLSQQFEYGDWNLMASHRQDIVSASNAATQQILPRFESDIFLPLFDNAAIIHFDQQSTEFDRNIGVRGTRVDLNPWLEIPLHMANGGFTSTIQTGYRHTRYWLKDSALPGTTMPTRSTFEASIDNRLLFERISDDRMWRHTLSPILRYDYINAPDQSQLPNFDSSFGNLSMSNLLSGNRFSGRDRIERLNRISLLLETGLQYKQGSGSAAHNYLTIRAGAAYDTVRRTVDAGLLPAATRPFSNLLGEILISPTGYIELTAGGQYDPANKYLATADAHFALSSEAGHRLNANWQKTDARYSNAAEIVTASANIQLTRRTALFGGWQYDLLLTQTQQASGGIRYAHPCWDVSLEGYRYRLKGSNTTSDIGGRFLIGLKGLGSVGS